MIEVYDDIRPTWDDTWMRMAYTIGCRSLCSRAQVGAVIVTRDNKVASVSYNGPPAGLEHNTPCSYWCPRSTEPEAWKSSDYSSCPSTHSEQNALLRADHSAIQGGTIYVYGAVCINCMKLIAGSGLKRVFHIVLDGDRHRDPERSEAFARSCGLEVHRVTKGW